jgi:hypothetical protein
MGRRPPVRLGSSNTGMRTELFFLIKIGTEEHMTKLLEHGDVYLNTVEAMRNYDATTGRGDPTEGRAYLTNYPAGTVEFEFMKRPVRYERLWIAHKPTEPLGNIYCVYCFGRHHTVGLSEFKLDPRCAQFGSHFVLIKDLPKFFRRMNRALKATGVKTENAIVKYYDERSYSGPLSVFHKPLAFAYQQELRFHLADKRGKPLLIQLGSLADIAELHPTTAFSHFKVIPKGYRHVSKGLGRLEAPKARKS